MRIRRPELSFDLTWWWVLGLLIAVPAFALAVLGLRSVKAERIEAEQQRRDRQAQAARLADAAIRTSLADLERQLRLRDASQDNSPSVDEDSSIHFFSYDRPGLLRFSRDQIYFGDSQRESARVEWTGTVDQLVEQARSAEVQLRPNEAIKFYKRIIDTEPRLGDWARWSVLRLEQKDDSQFLDALLTAESVSYPLSPSGLPLSLIACASFETLPAEDRGKYSSIVRRTLAGLRGGRWWLSYDERSFYDRELRSLAEPSEAAADARLEELANIARLVVTVPLRRDEPTRRFERGETADTMIVMSPSQKSATAWQGAALNEKALALTLGNVMGQVGVLQSGNAWIADETGKTIWGEPPSITAKTIVEPLPVVPGWALVFQPTESTGWIDQRALLWLGFIVILVATMLVSLVGTMSVVRRESDLARMQNDFIAGVSHEFKSPITSVRLLLERMAGGRVTSTESAVEYQAAVERELVRLEHHVNRLLEAQQIQAGRRRYDFAPASLSDIAARAIADLKPQAEAKQMRVEFEAGAGLPELQLDRDAMTDAIANLIANAIKYSSAGSRIAVAARNDNKQVCVEVSDEGIGIHRDDTKRIFNRFFRGKGSQQQSVNGTGLGLALVRATVQAHGGNVSVTSSPGRGSRFTISLPLDRISG